MKIGLAQINSAVGNVDKNADTILQYIKDYRESVDILIFPEMALSGYPPQDLLNESSFLDRVESSFDKIVSSVKDTVVIVGLPRRADGRLYNSAAVIQKGSILFFSDKTLLPSYDVFDETRYFSPSKIKNCPMEISVQGKKICLGVQICEDLWDEHYSVKVTDEMIKHGAEMIVNISASPFEIGRLAKRLYLCADKAKHLKYNFIYLNMVGGQDELVFDGNSFALNSNGDIVGKCLGFKEEIIIVDTDSDNAISVADICEEQQIFDALTLGVRDYFRKTNFSKAVVGLSGGIDSSLTAAIASQALGPDNVIGISLPSKFSSKHSIDDAKELAENLGIHYDLISIDSLFSEFKIQLQDFNPLDEHGTVEENLQARIRGNLLMALSNKSGALLLNTGNKTEIALGYCTMYGDMCGAIGVISDLNKEQVYSVSKWINKTFESNLIPKNVIDKKPSAELSPNQYDPFDYSIVSPLVDEIVNNQMNRKQLIGLGYDSKIVDDILNLVNKSEYKRKQSCPGIRVSPKAFGSGRRFPIANGFMSK